MNSASIALGVAVVGLLITIATLGFRIVRFMSRMELFVKQMKPVVQAVPHIHYRLVTVEKHLDLSTPEMPGFINGAHE